MTSTLNPRSASPVTATASTSPQAPRSADGRSRVVIEAVTPQVDAGRFPVKRSVGEVVVVEADAFTDGHDKIAVAVRHRSLGAGGQTPSPWQESELAPLVNDRWSGSFEVHAIGWHEFGVLAWVDRFATWRYDFQKRVNAGQDVTVDLLIGAELVEEAASAAQGDAARALTALAAHLRSDQRAEATEVALGASLAATMKQHGPRAFATESPAIRIWVDRAKARFSSWYELFPRSASNDPNRHGALKDVQGRLPSIAAMGFDTLYLPPIHPIGEQFRKGPNNNPSAKPGDLGSPWAIGSAAGGHDAIHPELGTLADFDQLVQAATEQGIEIAMDLAFQCAPDHPYVSAHPQWFRHRPDGTIQYAENPPKKYQDIYPFDFECDDWRAPVGRAPARGAAVLGRFAWRAGVPGRQPAHQAVPVLGVGHRAR